MRVVIAAVLASMTVSGGTCATERTHLLPEGGDWWLGECLPAGVAPSGWHGARAELRSREVEPTTAPCWLTAYRQDGALVIHSPPALVLPDAGLVEPLVLPDAPQGGIGVTFWVQPLRIVQVLPDQPADGALQDRDRIVAIDGAPTDGWSNHHVLERMAGPIGSDVRLTVARGATTHDVVVTRAFLDASLLQSPDDAP